MGIHQLSLSYDDKQDRLLLRVSTQASEEFRFWLTRRMTERLSPALQQAVQRLDAQQPGLVAPDERSRQLVSDFRHDDIIRHADFRTPYTPQTTLPLGESPMLLTDVNMRLQGQELLMELVDQSGPAKRQCEMQLNSQLLHGWLHLMAQVSQQARWGLGSHEEAAPSPEASAEASGADPAWRH